MYVVPSSPRPRRPLRPVPALRIAAALCLLLAPALAPVHAALCFVTGTFDNTALCWTPVNPVPDAFDIEDVVWNPDSGEYLAIGGGGAVLTSPDGAAWTAHDSGTTQTLFGGVWDPTSGRYIVVGDGGALLTSPDGRVWTAQVTNTRARLLDIAVSGDGTRYITVGERGTVLSSSDAIAWTESIVLSLARRPALYGIVWRDGLFVAVGSSTTIISSTDGIDWVEHNYSTLEAGLPPPPILRAVAVNAGGLFVAVGSSGTVWTSNNGSDWEPAPPIESHPGARMRAIVRISGVGQNFFLAVGDNGATDAPLALRSSDGLQWSEADLPDDAGATLKTLAFNGADVVAGGDQSLFRAQAATLEWEAAEPDPGLGVAIHDLAGTELADPRRYLAVGADGAVLSSADGFAWNAEDSGVDIVLGGIASGEVTGTPRAVTVGAAGTILYSDDGATWNAAESGTDEDLAAIAFGNGTFVTVGAAGTVATSVDGVAWSPGNVNGIGADLLGIAFGEAGGAPLFVAVGTGGALLTSSDGGDWTAVAPAALSAQDTLHAAIWNGDPADPRFVLVGATGGGSALAVHSADGADWTAATVPTSVPELRAVTWTGSQFLAASDGGVFLRSASGLGWTALGSPPVDGNGAPVPLPRMNALAWIGDNALAAGDGGRIHASGGVDIAVGVDDDVSISEEDDPRFADAGLDKIYRFTVSNIGNIDATNVVFTYTLPPEVAIDDLAPAVAPDPWTCTPNGDGLSCGTGRLAAGAGEAVIIEVTMRMPNESDLVLVHEVTVASSPADIQPANNLLTVTTQLGPRIAPGLPSPDVDFGDRGAFGAVGLPALVLLALIAALFRRAAPLPPRP